MSPRVEYSDNALEQLAELAQDGADDYLLDELKKQIETIAECPEITEQPCFPHHPDRGRAWYGQLFDSTHRMWGFTILVYFMEWGLLVRVIRGAPAPLHFND